MARILLVEDDPVDRKPLARLLEREGHRVTCASDASMALAAIMTAEPELILLDIGIPRMDGLTLLWRLRETASVRNTPVFVITGHDEPDMMQRARELGVSEYLVKSQFTPAELLALIRQYTTPLGSPNAAEGGTVVSSE